MAQDNMNEGIFNIDFRRFQELQQATRKEEKKMKKEQENGKRKMSFFERKQLLPGKRSKTGKSASVNAPAGIRFLTQGRTL